MAAKGLLGRIVEGDVEVSPTRRMLISGIAVLLLLLACLPYFKTPTARDAPTARQGEISFAGWKDRGRPVLLKGGWSFTWESPLGNIAAGKMPPTTMTVPRVWNGVVSPNGVAYPNRGNATYRLILKDLPPGRYRIAVPTIFAASEIRLDGRLVSSRGTIGTSAETTRYFWRAQDIGFDADGSDVELQISIAAHLHRDNGFEGAPAIGTAPAIHDWVSVRLSQKFLFQVSLMILGLFSFVVWLYRARDPSFAYFAGACFCLMPTSFMLGFDNLVLMVWPRLGFWPLLAIVYMTGVAGLFFIHIYVRTLYPVETIGWLYRTIYWAIIAFAGVQAVALAIGTYPASQVNVLLVGLMLVTFLYQMVVIARAVRAGRDGALPFLIGMSVMFAALMLVGSIAAGILPRNLYSNIGVGPLGVVVMLFSHIIVLAERWSRAISSSEANTDDLRQLLEVSSSITSEMELETLLTRIVEVTSRILRAERSTLYLHDARKDELWALFAEGVEQRIIRFPAHLGIAGHVFENGQPLIVDNAYADPHFNSEVDERTGFRTRNMIAVPIATREGRKLGVLQALNRRSGEGFGPTDLARMRAFAAQAAIALDNATLFSEVIASRNYNESILRSMSSGVVTLDPQAKVAKFNAAACAILRVSEELLEGVDARAWLATTNPPLIAELDAVSANSDLKTLLDFDLVTGDGSHRAVNITIVPLVSGAEEIGLLILLEDISEGKRLQGAMRRFMPQEVVEQVLGRDDDLMFGTSCRASVLFADIRNFTSMAEALSPRETVDMLNEIFTELFEAVAAASGMIDKYIGDAIMAVYGAPISMGDDAVNAAHSAVQMVAMVDALNQRRAARGLAPLRIGIGVATGEVVAGTIGSPKRMDYTVVGDTVNLASRLEEATKVYRVSIIVCEDTAAALGDVLPLRELDLIRARGRQRPARIFEIDPDGREAARAALHDHYAKGRAALSARDWSGASAAFAAALTIDPGDGPSLLMAQRARSAVDTPPPQDWDGVW